MLLTYFICSVLKDFFLTSDGDVSEDLLIFLTTFFRWILHLLMQNLRLVCRSIYVHSSLLKIQNINAYLNKIRNVVSFKNP